MLELTVSSKSDCGSYMICIAKTGTKKIRVFICSMKFLSMRLLYISINLPYDHAWNTVAMAGLVFVDATWNC